MSEPSPFQIAVLALQVLEQHRDWNNSKALQYAFNLYADAELCIANNQDKANEANPEEILKP